MDKVWFVSDDKISEVKDKVFKDETINRASITIRSAKSLDFNKEGNFLIINGAEEIINHAKEILNPLSEEAEEDEAMEVVTRLKDSEDNVAAGLSGIFG